MVKPAATKTKLFDALPPPYSAGSIACRLRNDAKSRIACLKAAAEALNDLINPPRRSNVKIEHQVCADMMFSLHSVIGQLAIVATETKQHDASANFSAPRPVPSPPAGAVEDYKNPDICMSRELWRDRIACMKISGILAANEGKCRFTPQSAAFNERLRKVISALAEATGL